MSINIGINGFGRIGRMVLRAGINNPNIRFVAINDLVPAENLAYLMKYDSTHGRFPGNCLLYTSPSPRDGLLSRMPSSA